MSSVIVSPGIASFVRRTSVITLDSARRNLAASRRCVNRVTNHHEGKSGATHDRADIFSQQATQVFQRTGKSLCDHRNFA